MPLPGARRPSAQTATRDRSRRGSRCTGGSAAEARYTARAQAVKPPTAASTASIVQTSGVADPVTDTNAA